MQKVSLEAFFLLKIRILKISLNLRSILIIPSGVLSI